jgi:hypothetical protein
MKEFSLQDTLRVSDSKIKGFVVMEREDGTTVFAKPNMIVKNGRNFIKDLVYNQVATNSTVKDPRKFSHIRFGSGTTPTSPDDNDLEAYISTISDTEVNITDSIWSEYLGNDNLTGPEDYNNQYKWFDETIPGGGQGTLYELNGPGIWDNGTIITTTQPTAPFPIGTQWFNETNNILYTAITEDTWSGAIGEILDVTEPDFQVDDIYYNDKNDKYYIFEPILTILPLNNAIGLKITIDVTGESGTDENSSELGLFLIDTTNIDGDDLVEGSIYKDTSTDVIFISDGTETGTFNQINLFSRVVFDPIPITDTLKYKLTYYIYF